MLVPALVAAVLAGCSAPPLLASMDNDPSDPGAQAPPVRYWSDIGTYVRQRPAEPRPWGERNERVAPQPRTGE